MSDEPRPTDAPRPPDPGRPAAPAEEPDVDPELLLLPRRRRGRHPILSVAVIALAAYLLFIVRLEFLYFFQPRRPLDLGDVSEAVQRGTFRPNTYVTVNGAPDRKHALLLQGRLTGYDSFFRLLQSRSRLFVQQHRTQRTTDRTVSGSHSGRLVQFASLPYKEALAATFAQAITTAHDLELATLKQVAPGSSARVKDRAGEEVALAPDTVLWINATYPEEWIVQVPKRTHPAAESAAKLVAGLGLPFATDDESSRTFHRFVVLASDAEASQLMARFKGPDAAAGVVRRQVSYTARWDQVRFEKDALVVTSEDASTSPRYRRRPGDKTRLEAVKEKTVSIPAASVLYLSVGAKFVVPEDALVIVAGEEPADYWHYVLLYVVLATFMLINVLALAARWREHAASRRSSAAR
ncbi:MAG: hypothetical protein IT371_03160 [Deltaproteobacteria bacterium]|nr:hypothetical protein [Deltaproteobacteria bacterium]